MTSKKESRPMNITSNYSAVLMLIATFFYLPAQSQAQPYEQQLRTIAATMVTQLESAGQKSGTVLDFTDLGGQSNQLSRLLTQEVSDQLVASAKTMSFINRMNLDHLLRENKLSMEGLIAPESAGKLGNLIGIDTIITGTITPIGNSIRLSVRAVAPETGKIVSSQSTTLPMAAQLLKQ